MSQTAAAILPEDLTRQIDLLAADSFQNRTTPSVALDRTADYLTDQLRQLGLHAGFRHWNWRAGGEDTSWTLRYPVPGQRRLDYAASNVTFTAAVAAGGRPVVEESGVALTREVAANLARDAHFAAEAGPPVVAQASLDLMSGEETAAGSGRAVLVGGPLRADSLALAAVLAPIDLDKRVAIYVPPAGGDTAIERAVLARLYAWSRGVVIVRDTGPIEFAAVVAAWQRRSLPVVDGYLRAAAGVHRWPWAIEVRPETIAGVLAGVGVDLAQVRAATAPVVRPLDGLQVRLHPAIDSTVPAAPVTAPIVAALVKGTDSLLAGEYVILVTHMDTPAIADSVPNAAAARAAAARANAVNVAGLLALARAFQDPAVHLRRSMLLLVTSGEAGTPASWSGNYLIQEAIQGTFELGGLRSILLTFDMGGGGSGDSLVVDGRSLLKLIRPPAAVVAAHPELGVTLVDTGSAVALGSTASAFIRNFLPGLALHRPAPADAAGAEVVPIESERAAHLLRYVFYLGYALANAEQSPQWNAEGRQAFLRLQGR